MPSQRLRSRREIEAVLRGGAEARSESLRIRALARRDSLPCRLAIVAGRRCGGAVVRNRIKRRVKGAWRHLDCRGLDVVVVATAEVAEVDFQILVDSLKTSIAAASRVPA